MTAIEFFDHTPIENIIGALTTLPEKIIYIGEKDKMKKRKRIYKDFFAGRHLEIQIEYKPINKDNINNIVQVLTDIVLTEESCVFDITGGDEMVLVAMGMVFEKYKHKNLQMMRFNVFKGQVCDCDNDGKTNLIAKPTLTVEENIKLHGGSICYATKEDPDKTTLWDLTDDFINDVNKMWGICRLDPGNWNVNTSAVKNMQAFFGDKDALEISIDLNAFKQYLADNKEKQFFHKKFFYDLANDGLIFINRYDDEKISFKYKNEQVKSCLIKEGTLLEIKVLIVANSIIDQNGQPHYTDSLSGVYIDWDGEAYEANDALNEIDVILMRGMSSAFISCKNGNIDTDELYKLDAVTNRFGDVYAKKVLIATYLGKKGKSMDAFKERARQMKINFLANVHELDDDEFAQKIKDLLF